MKSGTISIHRIILSRLVPAWIVLSLAMGVSAYWLESRRMDRHVFDLAAEAARHFDLSAEQSLFEGNASDHLPALKELLRGSQFAGMRLFGKDKQPLIEVWDKPDPALKKAMEAHSHAFPTAGTHHHTAIRSAGRLSVWALVPLVDSGQNVYGYFEGIYLVPSQAVAAIQARVRDALTMVLIVTTLATLALYPVILALNRDTVRLSKSLLEGVVELMRVLGSAIAKRDSDTDSHNYRVALYAIRIAELLGRPKAEIASLIAGAFLHDIGKIGIPDGILLKKGRLTAEEFEVMKTHVVLGEDIVHESKWLFRAQEVVSNHHERFDGSGYPRNLKGAEIPFNARLFAIVDVFDALTSERPYKKALPWAQAMEIMKRESGHHFDPELFVAFEGLSEDLLDRFGNADSSLLKESLAASVEHYFPT